MGEDQGAEGNTPLVAALPAHLGRKPKRDKDWALPTAWLLGTELASSLRDIGITSMFEFDAREWMNAGAPIDLGKDETGECWIDFLADSGDSQRLVYQLAYLLQQPSLKIDGIDLPRGRALIFGGDTAYPIATRRRLLERVRAPFLWARAELGDLAAPLDPPVTLVGIPGNHDYYNELTGFEPMFHAGGVDPESVPLSERVDLAGYVQQQQASYFALELPHHWQVLGLDVELAEIDPRQREFFRKLPASDRRIVVTSKPTLVYHALTEHAVELAKSYAALDLPTAFAADGVLATGMRLDLSGDTHTYERYWGADGPAAIPAGKRGPDRFEATSRANYASVVSGLGGAFHHPGQVRLGDTKPRRAWPSEAASAARVGGRLIDPREMFQAGAVGVAGMIISALCFWLVLLGPAGNVGNLVAVFQGLPMPHEHPYVLDIPLTLGAGGQEVRDAICIALTHLAIVASIIGALGLTLYLTGACYAWGKRLARPIDTMADPTTIWSRSTRAIAEARPVFAVLHWLGGNPRNLWGILITSPAWLIVAAMWTVLVAAMHYCTRLGDARDGFIPAYVVIVIVAIAMIFLGVLVAGARAKKTPLGVLKRSAFGLLGLVTAFLILWTPYAWTKLAIAGKHWMVVLFGAYYFARLVLSRYGAVSPRRRTRQLVAVLGFSTLAVFYCVIPWWGVSGLDHPGAALPAWGIPIAGLLGAYTACLWMGWYFYICLQFDSHGNEAGGGARIIEFAQFLRIRITKDEAMVWVIAAEQGEGRDPKPVAQLVDHFTVTSKTSRAT